MSLQVGDKIKVVRNFAGDMFDGGIGDEGVVIMVLDSPNLLTGAYPGVRYATSSGRTFVALEAELERKIG